MSYRPPNADGEEVLRRGLKAAGMDDGWRFNSLSGFVVGITFGTLMVVARKLGRLIDARRNRVPPPLMYRNHDDIFRG